MDCSHTARTTHGQTRKRPFRARKRVLSARANSKSAQTVAEVSGEVEPGLHEKNSRASKGGAPRGNKNRFIHGRYARERRELYAAIRAHIAEGRRLIALGKMALAQRAMDGVFENIQPPPRAEVEARSASGGGLPPRPNPHPKNPSDFSTSPQGGGEGKP
jgi:hypothetical protein